MEIMVLEREIWLNFSLRVKLCIGGEYRRTSFFVIYFSFFRILVGLKVAQSDLYPFSRFQVRLANTKTNKSSTIYGTDSYVVSLTTK